jgi:hypothetical protein
MVSAGALFHLSHRIGGLVASRRKQGLADEEFIQIGAATPAGAAGDSSSGLA